MLTKRDRIAGYKALEEVFKTRRANIARFKEVAGSWNDLARLCGQSPQLLVNIAGPNPNRSISERLARALEDALQLPAGWLDQRH